MFGAKVNHHICLLICSLPVLVLRDKHPGCVLVYWCTEGITIVLLYKPLFSCCILLGFLYWFLCNGTHGQNQHPLPSTDPGHKCYATHGKSAHVTCQVIDVFILCHSLQLFILMALTCIHCTSLVEKSPFCLAPPKSRLIFDYVDFFFIDLHPG